MKIVCVAAFAAVAALVTPRSAAAQAPGGFVESATSTVVRPRPTAGELQALLPLRGRFNFPAPYNTTGVRLTNGQDCAGGTDCVSAMAGSGWQMLNNSAGSNSLYVAVQLDKSNGGVGPSLIRYNKITGETVNTGPLFDAADARSSSSMDGWYFSPSLPTSLYLSIGRQLQRYDILTQTTTVVFDITSQFGADKLAWHPHTSNNDLTHSFVVSTTDNTGALGCGVYHEDTHQLAFYPGPAELYECEVDRSGLWMLIKEDRDGVGVIDNRIVNLTDGTETVLLAANGAAWRSDNGFGTRVAADPTAALTGAVRTWTFGSATPGPIVYHSLDGLPPSMTEISFANARPGALDQQYACGAAVNRLDGPRANELICVRLDGSLTTLVVAPVMTDLDAIGGGPNDDEIKQPLGMLDPTGEYFLWLSNVGGNRMDAFLAYLPSQLIVTIAPPAGGPDVTGVTASGIGAHRATISWTTGQPADGQVDYGPTNLYGLSTLLNPALSTTHARTLTGLLPGTTYHFRVTSKNGQGAATTSGDLTFVTIGPPVISSITVSSVTIDSATIQWTTDQASTSVVRFGAETGDVRRAGSEALVTAHRVALQNLSAGRTYHFRVTSRNAEELDTTSADLTFTTPAPPPPTFRGVASLGITPDQATIAWTTDRHTRARVEYGTTAGYGRRTEMDDEFRLTRTDRLSGLTPNTTYHFRVCVVSRDGQWALSPDLTFKTPPAPPKKDDRERHRGHKHGPEGDKDCDRKNGR